MTSDLQELYQEVIMDHNVRPRNFKRLADATGSSHGFNPFCGDDFTVDLKVQDGVITDIGFQGAGCAISKSTVDTRMKKQLEMKKIVRPLFLASWFHHRID